MANNLTAIVNCMQTPDATKEAPDLTNIQNLLNQDVGDYYSEPLTWENKLVVVDMISRSFAEKGDLTTLANVTYDNIAQQVNKYLHIDPFINGLSSKYKHFSPENIDQY